MSTVHLSKKSLTIVFAYAPAGLGHLRVTEALNKGLPESVSPLLLGSQDKSISALYRFISLDPSMRVLMEFFQHGIAESFFTYWYRYFLRSHTRVLYEQLLTILDEQVELPEVLLLVATHFGLAHQAAEIKETVEKERKIKVLLVVQVTDDSPQPIWFVERADVIFVPSKRVRNRLMAYGRASGFSEVPFVVTPYPVNPDFSQQLSSNRYYHKKSQVDPVGETVIHVALPISGAAVHTEFYSELIDLLSEKSKRFLFHVVSKEAPYTKRFLTKLLISPAVKLLVSDHDRGVVSLYDKLYTHETLAFEITKPSEQAFKALFTPSQVGGVILLFSSPVGRQEHDNLDFLERHDLIPTKPQHTFMLRMAKAGKVLSDLKEGAELLKQSSHWRGIVLPKNAEEASLFIGYLLKNHIFSQMFLYRRNSEDVEVSDRGVEEFWREVGQLLEK